MKEKGRRRGWRESNEKFYAKSFPLTLEIGQALKRKRKKGKTNVTKFFFIYFTFVKNFKFVFFPCSRRKCRER